MRDKYRDPLRLEHILEAIDRLIEANTNRNLDNLSEKDLSYFGIIKLLEIIGEAAYKLTNEFKVSHPETPWKNIIGMRHILVHGYYQINKLDVIKTIRENLPVLKQQVQSYLREFPE